jgi:uncharacterized protein YjbI with pentapeptide repeats
VARTATLTAVRRLDGRRKGEVIRFLAEAGLLNYPIAEGDADLHHPIVNLADADLHGANLANARLHNVTLDGDLRGARFDNANMERVSFAGADLRGASFDRAPSVLST